MELVVTPKEQAAGRLTTPHLLEAVTSIRRDGFVVLTDVVDPEHLDVVRAQMNEDSQRLLAENRWGGAGQVKGHLQQGAPPHLPYVFGDIVANPFAIQVSIAVLGEGAYNRFYNGNANCPGSGTQPLHADAPHLWPDLTVPHPAHALVINVPLLDATEENGATEIWPGTHLLPFNGQHIATDVAEARRRIVPPMQAVTHKGSILIRDMRMWHRGVPNRSQEIRHMIAMVHQIKWLQRPHTLLFERACEAAFPPVAGFDHNVEFTDEPLTYLFSRTPTLATGTSSTGTSSTGASEGAKGETNATAQQPSPRDDAKNAGQERQ